jgi:tetratricopeptide (TPR) repeat protein
MKKNLYISFALIMICSISFAQIMPVTLEPDGGNKTASVSEQIGIVKIEINYSRPGVKGREGKIYNTPIAFYGFVDQGHGTSTSSPWRAGANENTTISFSHPVKIEGKDLPAGKYGFFIALGETESTLIFSKVNNSWGSFYYDANEDALRVVIKNQNLEKSVEWLKYEFTDETDNSATIVMSWEKKAFPFKVEADTKKLQFEAFKSDYRTTRPYYDFLSGIYWCIRNDYELEQALAWADRAAYFRVMGEKNFRTLSAKAAVLTKMNRMDEANKLMEEALPMGTMQDVHFHGRNLLNQNQAKEAFKVFKMNFDKYPKEYTTNVGMGRAYSALGEYKKAIPFLKTASKVAPDETNRARVDSMIKTLEEGKNIN